MKPLVIIEAPSNLGLKEPFPGKEPGVRELPQWLRSHGLHEILLPYKIDRLEAPAYSMDYNIESGVSNADKIKEYSELLADKVFYYISEKKFLLVLGGDCSILIACALALKLSGKYGLFFLDGHTDFVMPHNSQTKGAAGMDLAIVTGNGHDKLTNIRNKKPYIKEEWVWCAGNREYDQQYLQPILKSKINYYDLKRLREEGTGKCIDSFIKMVNEENFDGFWIHVDVDVLDDNIMPAVDSRNADGLSYAEFEDLLQPLLAHPKAAGMEITILDPQLDKDGMYTKAFVKVLSRLLGKKAGEVGE